MFKLPSREVGLIGNSVPLVGWLSLVVVPTFYPGTVQLPENNNSLVIVDLITVRIRRIGEGNSFSYLVCPHPGGTYPGQVQMGKGVPQGTYPPLPARSGQGRGTPRYLPPPGQEWEGEGVPQGTYSQSGQDDGRGTLR